MKHLPIETERLILRPMEDRDLPLLEEMMSDPIVMKYYGPAIKKPEFWLKAVQESYLKHGMSFLAVELRDSKTFIGQAGILFQDVEGVTEQESAYMFKREFWGKGYATEATRALLKYAYDHLSPRRFISLINPENVPSIKMAERNGMRYERSVVKWEMTCSLYSMSLETYLNKFRS